MVHICVKTSKGKEVPLKTVNISVNVLNNVAQFTLHQFYVNNDSDPIEAYYTFPTPSGASVFDFSAKVNDKLIKAVLKDKDEAKEEYNKAISHGDGAFLMERIDGDIFSVALGNVPSKSNLELVIKYCVELKTEIDASQLRLNIPMTIMPKYVSTNAPKSSNGSLVNPTKVSEKPYDLSISGNVVMQDSIVSFNSKTCKINMSNMKENSLSFKIEDLEQLNEDTILVIQRNMPKSCCLTQRMETSLTNEMYRFATMVNVVPSFDDIPQVNPEEVHYVVLMDNSGSMQGDDMENCKQGAKLLLLALPENSTFDVYKFNSSFSKFGDTKSEYPCRGQIRVGDNRKWYTPSGKSTSECTYCEECYNNFVKGTPSDVGFSMHQQLWNCNCDFPEELKVTKVTETPTALFSGLEQIGKAVEWINNIHAGGGTELNEAMKDVYKTIKQTGKRGVLLLLSDGGISDTDEVLKFVKANRYVDVFTIGIGKNVSQKLIQGIADAGHGKAEFVNSGTDEIKKKMHSQLKKAQSNLVRAHDTNNIQIDAFGPYKTVPEKIPTLYENDLNTFYIFSQNPINKITYIQSFKDYTLNSNVPVETYSDESYPLHRMAGVKLIDELNTLPVGSQIGHLSVDPNKKEIIDVSLNTGVISNHTSFIAVEVREEVDKVTQKCKLVEVPLQLPSKYNDYGYEGLECMSLSACSMNSRSMCMPQSASFSSMSRGPVQAKSLKSSNKSMSRKECAVRSSFQDCRFDAHSDEEDCDMVEIPKYDIKLTIDKLPIFTKIDNMLTGKGLFPFAVAENDYISVTGEGVNNGVYKVYCLGSNTERWVLEKVSS